VSSRTTLCYPLPRDNPNSRPLNHLQPLSPRQKSQLLWNQANPASFSKIPGWGGYPERNYGTPGVGYTLTSRPCGISNPCPLLCVTSAPGACPDPVGASLYPACPEFRGEPRGERYPGSAHCLVKGATTCRINTCKSVSKQMTLTPFRITTYEKPRGGVHPSSSPCPLCSDLSALCVKPPPAFAGVPNCPLHDYYGMEENWIPRRASQSHQSTQPAGKGLSQRNGIQFRIRG
jgi:hypothetical protein